MTAVECQQRLTVARITLNRQQQGGDALTVAAYHTKTQTPVPGWLLSDDAPVYGWASSTISATASSRLPPRSP